MEKRNNLVKFPNDREIIKKLSDPNHEGNLALTPDATPNDREKYEIQQNILGYVLDNNISEQELKRILKIKEKSRLECLLFAHIENFSLDELVSYATELFAPFDLKIVRPNEKVHLVAHPKTNGRARKHL